MAERVTLEGLLTKKEQYVKKALEGAVFLYPTDSVYGLGAVYSGKNHKRIAAIKKRPVDKPVSCIVPSYRHMADAIEGYDVNSLQRLIAPYRSTTLIYDHTKPGMRFIDHPMQKFVSCLGESFISTSSNIAGEAPLTCLDSLDNYWEDNVDIIVDGGVCANPPSVLIDFVLSTITPRDG